MEIMIIGCGNWCIEGEIIQHWINSGATINAIADINRTNLKKAESICIKFNQKPKIIHATRNNLDYISNEKTDVVAVFTNPLDRFDILMYLLKNQLSLYIEKPLCANREEAEIIYNQYNSQKIYDNPASLPITGTGLAGRAPTFNKILELRRNKKFGKLKTVHFSYAWRYAFLDKNHWRGNPKMGGGHIFEKLIHYLDAIFWSLGPFKKIEACGIRHSENLLVHKEISAILENDEYSVHIASTFGTSFCNLFSLNAVFEKETLHFANEDGRQMMYNSSGNRTEIGNDNYWWPSKQIENFMTAYNAKQNANTCLKDAFDAFILANSIQQILES